MRTLLKILRRKWELKKIKKVDFLLVKIRDTSIILNCFTTVFGSKRYKFNLYAEKTGILLEENIKRNKIDSLMQKYKNKAKEAGKTLDEYFEELATAIRKGKSQNIIAKFVKGIKLELIGPRFKKLYGGGIIVLHPEKTVAITGILDDVKVIKGLGLENLLKQGSNPGGLDMLSSPIWGKLKLKYKALESTNNKLYWKKITQDFWDQVNRPWLDDIIARGDDVRFISDPSLETSKYVFDDKLSKFATDEFGKKVPTIFSKEVEYLKNNGYEIIGHIARKIN
ncbi:hypothetical protein [Kordia zhangzhouensis]|uniref:hypothetical protein n=1 Tax=Kordia zhangzhouensis TaxID=1620405 RepID=UPI000629ABDC|nr:hypothetical protein [Kordia zhangzhouensis]